MFEIELTSSFLEYDDKFFEIVYSDDHPDFIYIPWAPPIFILCPHQFFAQVVREQPPEELFEAKSDTKLSPLEHLHIW